MNKRIKLFALLISMMFLLVGCRKEETIENGQSYFNATIIETNNNSVQVKVTDGKNSGISVESEVTVSLSVVSADEVPELSVGDTIRVVFNGEVKESYPLQLGTVFAIFHLDENGEVVAEEENPIVDVIDGSKEPDFACAQSLELIYEDEKNAYFLGCIMSDAIIVKFKDGTQKNIKQALGDKDIIIDELENYGLSYIVEAK